MALRLVNQAGNPLGQFDGLDSEYLTLKGGEVVTFASVAVPGTDLGAADAFDGYMNPSSVQKRPVVTKTLVSGSRPLMLADDGISGYGTMFGQVVGGVTGQIVTGGAQLGPHTATGSGKVTCWHLPGMFAVSLDACDTAATGLQPTNTTLDVGAALTYTTGGLLTPVGSAAAVGGAPTVGRFVEFTTNGSLVSTPNTLVSALNSPYGAVATQKQFAFAVFSWNPPA